MTFEHWLIFGAFVIVAWSFFIYFWPRMMLLAYKRALLRGAGEGPIPINTLYTEPQKLFAEPLAAQTGSGFNVWTTGVNHDCLVSAGWLDLSKGPLILHVPEMDERYYSVQFTDASKNTVFAYVGKRTTGTRAGDYLINGPGWKGTLPPGMKQISSPNNAVLVLARVLVYSDSDVETVYALSKQVQLTPLSDWQPRQ